MYAADGKPVDATQELIAIGLANIANSFVQAFPGAGALARSAVNNSSGVKTPMGGLYTGLLVILALLFFTPYFYYIPKSSLAAIIIAAVIFMVEVKVVKPMWRTKSKFHLIYRKSIVKWSKNYKIIHKKITGKKRALLPKEKVKNVGKRCIKC